MRPNPGRSYAPYCIYNIGNNQPVELIRYIQVLEECLGKKARMDMLPMQPGDVLATMANTDELNQAVGFKPDTPIDTGIANFVAWYKSYYGIK